MAEVKKMDSEEMNRLFWEQNRDLSKINPEYAEQFAAAWLLLQKLQAMVASSQESSEGEVN